MPKRLYEKGPMLPAIKRVVDAVEEKVGAPSAAEERFKERSAEVEKTAALNRASKRGPMREKFQ